MTLRELLHERGDVLSLLDLVELMKEIDIGSVTSVLASVQYCLGRDDGLDLAVSIANGKKGAEKPQMLLGMSGLGGMLDLLDLCAALDFRATAASIKTFAELDAVEGTPNPLFDVRLRAIADNFRAESAGLRFFCLEHNRVRFWSEPSSGWEDVIAVLDDPKIKPALSVSTIEEQIVEASRCLAVGRGTACVLHLNNVLEIGIRRMRRKLPAKYVPGQKSEIDDWISAINTYVQQSTPPSDAPIWKSVSAYCVAIRLAWRHPAAHADMIFTEESAHEAYIAIRGLMREIIKV